MVVGAKNRIRRINWVFSGYIILLVAIYIIIGVVYLREPLRVEREEVRCRPTGVLSVLFLVVRSPS